MVAAIGRQQNWENDMQINQKELFAVRFADCMGRLRNLGLKAEISVTGGIVMVATTDKTSASCFRKAIKSACAKCGAVFVENRPAKSYVFTIAV